MRHNLMLLLPFFYFLFVVGCNQVSGINDLTFAGTDSNYQDTDSQIGTTSDSHTDSSSDTFANLNSSSDSDSCNGCWIEDICYTVGQAKPGNICQKCNPQFSTNGWSDNDGVACDDKVFCNGADTCGGGSCSINTGSPCNAARTCMEIDESCICEPRWPGDDCSGCLFFVNGDSGDDAGSGSTAGMSWDLAYATVQKAIDEAVAEDCEIWVAATQTAYVENVVLKGGMALYGGFVGDEIHRNDRDWMQHETTINGNASDSVVTCLAVNNCGSNAIVDGFTISNGNAADGGGMYIASASPTVSNCIFQFNSAVSKGGGMYNKSSDTAVTNCIFNSNSAQYGAGMSNDTGSSPVVSDCSFSDNSTASTSGGKGGGIYNATNANSKVRNCTFEDNYASAGGGIYNWDANPIITNCVFSQNASSGVQNLESSSPVVTNCIFSGNSSQNGGAVHNTNSSAVLTNCLFLNNTASGNGGAIYNWSSTSSITNSTLTGNSAESGGGIFNYNLAAQSVINNCILWNNSATTDSEIADWNNAVSIVKFSDVQGGFTGTENIDSDPLFASGSHRLTTNSPCIDKGNTNALPLDVADLDVDSDVLEKIPYDLDNMSREKGGFVDMGSYEF